jgi:hypothetical protein
MKTRGTGIVGYNVQTAVDAKHDLIVAHEVSNVGTDRDQLCSMATKARTAMGTQELTVVADRRYFKGEEILACSIERICAVRQRTSCIRLRDRSRAARSSRG